MRNKSTSRCSILAHLIVGIYWYVTSFTLIIEPCVLVEKFFIETPIIKDKKNRILYYSGVGWINVGAIKKTRVGFKNVNKI